MGNLESIHHADRELSPSHYGQLEAGHILFFPQLDVGVSQEDRRFLLGQRQTEASFHKNIAYRPAQDVLTGVARGTDREQLRRILRAFSQHTLRLLERLLPRYARNCRLDFTSYRPFEEEGRPLALHSRNDLLHVDAFPTRPTNGDRILRFFTNLNPEQPRVWLTGEPFEKLAWVFAQEAGLTEQARRSTSGLRQALARLDWLPRWLTRSPYDALMHRFHNFLKQNREFQETCPRQCVEFPPGSSWIVFTDAASHAVLAGRFALEQTFIVSRHAMLEPERAPLGVLERLTGIALTRRAL